MRQCKICKQNKDVTSDGHIYRTNGKRWRGRVCPDCTPKSPTKSYSLECKVCKTTFTSNRKRSFCTPKCFRIDNRSRYIEYYKNYNKIKSSNLKRYCPTCGNIVPSVNRKYCRGGCRPKQKRKSVKKIRPHKSAKFCKVHFNLCNNCGKLFTHRRSKSECCRPLLRFAPVSCKVCSLIFTPIMKTNVLCSKKCRMKLRRYNEDTVLKQATPAWVNKYQILKFISERPDGTQVDHIIPLRHPEVCGLNVLHNLQYLYDIENSFKSNQFDFTNENESWRLEFVTKYLTKNPVD